MDCPRGIRNQTPHDRVLEFGSMDDRDGWVMADRRHRMVCAAGDAGSPASAANAWDGDGTEAVVATYWRRTR